LADAGFVPVAVAQNQPDIFPGGLLDARVLPNYKMIVTNQAGTEGIGTSRERHGP
jgi:hypothetical protein